MRLSRFFCLSWLLLAPATNVAAQVASQPGPTASTTTIAIDALSAPQERELARWFAAIVKWQEYDAKWRNRPVHNEWAHVVERKSPPAAPAWLASRCAAMSDASILDLEPRTAAACRLLDDPRAVPPVPVAVPDSEPKHSTFLTRLHLDVLATQGQMDARVYGIIGTHMSLVDVGRLQLFGPPGVLLLTVPSGHGGRRVTFGYNWGASVRLVDMRVGSPTKNMTLFLNISKVWLGTGQTGVRNTRGYDIVGFSIAPRKNPS